MWLERLYRGYQHYWLPLALLLLLTGMFWVGDRSLYHKLYYLTLAAPTLLLLLCRPHRFAFLCSEPLFLLFVGFALYVMLSLNWSPAPIDYSKLKHPLYIGMLIVAVAALGESDMRRLVGVVALASLFAVLAALVTITAHFAGPLSGYRLEGVGALYNPLLTSHVYGFFAVVWLAALVASPRLWAIKLLLFLALVFLLFLTGSRTPFMALGVCTAWLVVMVSDRRVIWLALALGVTVAIGLWFFDSALLERGLSYRPLIWADAWRQILPALWFGHGYDAGIDIVIVSLNVLLADPHNLTLGVVYQTGLVGGAMWLAIYVYSLLSAWRLRGSGLVLISSTLLVFGFAAGMTEGGSFMSRPKEHWFLIWIPLAIHLAVLRKIKADRLRAEMAG
ncbi:O-antigen ligase family protein [Ectopseudomonas alcaliphila]|uniref:O-Antigen ligase n=1 Tax=Ectopseudomonas alcaliphila TaxID=101564 RepID=A0A1G6YA59_9GAMM|nr:O-antigen ligase family protein [Pseudomonas alcaliphila]MDX5992492.1 O-antigen ligase family protein [Pseudomonas alcaliphila]SDD86466.1 O-Antigen ligase [Pseudomonas alcaliphila]